MVAALSWTDHTRRSGVTVTVGGFTGTWSTIAIDANYPGSNTLNDDPSSVMRVNYATSSGTNPEFYIQWDWASNLATRALGAFNVRAPSNIIHVLFQLMTASGSDVYTSGVTTIANLIPIPGHTDRYQFVDVPSSDQSAGRFRIRVKVPTGGSGYVEVGKPWAGPALVLNDGIAADWSLDTIDPSTVTRSRGGGLSATKLPTRSRLTIPLTARTYAEMMGAAGSTLNLRHMAREAGLSSPVLVIPRSSDSHASQTQSLFGAITELPSIAHQGGNYFGARMVVEEIR